MYRETRFQYRLIFRTTSVVSFATNCTICLNFIILQRVLKGWYHFKPVTGTILDRRRNL